MPEQLDDAALEGALLALAADLAMPDVDDFTALVLARLPRTGAARAAGDAPGIGHRTRRRRRRWSIVVAAIVAASTATTLAIPDARAAVADWLGIDGVRIVRVDELPTSTTSTPSPTSTSTVASGATGPATPGYSDTSVMSMLGLVPERSLDDAAARIGVPVRRPTLVGLAAADLVGSGTSSRPVQLAQVWRSSGSLRPSAGLPEVAIVFAQLKVGEVSGGFQKALPRGATLEEVRVNGRPAWWISGDMHELSFFTAANTFITDSNRLAGDTLLWAVDGVTYRLESSLGKAGAVAFAESLR